MQDFFPLRIQIQNLFFLAFGLLKVPCLVSAVRLKCGDINVTSQFFVDQPSLSLAQQLILMMGYAVFTVMPQRTVLSIALIYKRTWYAFSKSLTYLLKNAMHLSQLSLETGFE